MRLAIISDVHADAAALADALTEIERLGCDLILCAGDLVDYGTQPNETLELLRQSGAICIRGNHERWKLHPKPQEVCTGPAGTSDEDWLSPESLAFIGALPLSWEATLEGVRVAMWHARPASDIAGIYPDIVTLDEMRRWLTQTNAEVLIVGHTHIPFALTALGGGTIVNPGALLRTLNDATLHLYDPVRGRFVVQESQHGGTFGVLELPSCRFTVYRAGDGAEATLLRRLVATR